MPTSREDTAPLQDLDPGMSNPLDFSNTELSFDADDWMNDSSPPLLDDFYNQDPDILHSFESTRAADPKRFLSPGPNFGLSQSGLSPESSLSSSQDSASVSSSSKRTQSSSSPQTRSSGDDITMTDGLNVKQEVNYDDYLHMDDDQPLGLDGTINPRSIEQTFGRNDYSHEGSFDFQSDSSGSTPDNPTQTAPSPEIEHASINTLIKGSSPHTRGHNKVFSQYSLTQGMSGLKTNGSREVSPTSGYILSQDSSPTAVFNSPSPGMAHDFIVRGPSLAQGLDNAPYPNGLPPASIHPPPPYTNFPMSLTGVPPYAMFPQASFDQTPPTYHLHVDKIPLKSRVETQIPIKLRLSPMPPNIKRLHLPAHTISKPKLLAKPRAERSPDMLELYTNLVCTSSMQTEKNKQRALARAASPNPLYNLATGEEDDENKPANGGDIRICRGCIQRERKRADRKKSKKPEEEESWRRDEERRVIVFNTHEIKDWQHSNPNSNATSEFMMEGLVDAPMRIACYCRHHSEKSGFQVIFTIKDYQDRVIAQAFSDSIMITDDHKTHPMPNMSTAALKGQETPLVTPPSTNPPSDQVSLGPGPAFRSSHSTSDLTAMRRQSIPFQSSMLMHKPPQPPHPVPAPRNLSRPASPGIQGPSTKKRKANSSTKLPTELAMTRLETSHFPTSQAPNTQLNGPMSGNTSPFSPNVPTFPPTSSDSSLFTPKQTGHGSVPQPFTNGPPTPNSNVDHPFFSNNNRSSSLDNLAMTQVYSAPVSAHPSRAPSPNGLRNSISVSAAHQQAQISQALQNGLYPLPMGLNMGAPPPSIINKVVPSEGPKSGCIEVTILGQGFYQGLDVMFGDQRATTTTFWGENSLVCLVPASSAAITVPVSLRHPNQQYVQQFAPNGSHATFRYIDDDEQQLLRQALTVLSKKMTGKLEDAKDIARRIMDNSAGGGPSGGGHITGYGASGGNFEAQLLKVLELIDLDDSSHKARLNLQRRSTGQSMLHHACALGLHRFVAGLLARGADPDIRDNGGYTPLHLAALNDQPEIFRRLIHARADPTLRTLSGETAADMAKKTRSRDVLLVLQRIERQHVRSRSGGSLYSRASRASRASSATSLKSLWESPSAPLVSAEYKTDESDSGVESPEYSQFASSDDEREEESDQEWLDMRRSSVHSRRAMDVSPVSRLPSPRGDVPVAPGSPATAAMGHLKEQLAAHFQQILAQIPSSIAQIQFPSSIAMPNPLPDFYQSSINSATFQHLRSLMPNMNGSRPGSSRDEPVSKDLESRWWLSSLMSSYAMPPSYEEIYPQQDMDTKQASAATAAAEYEADSKCATLYDQATTSETSTRQQLPARLQIGRKNAITREQQENFRRAHAERRKGLSRDTSLYMFWIPVLVLVLAAWFPGVFTKAWSYLPTVSFQGAAVAQNHAGPIMQNAQERVAGVV